MEGCGGGVALERVNIFALDPVTWSCYLLS